MNLFLVGELQRRCRRGARNLGKGDTGLTGLGMRRLFPRGRIGLGTIRQMRQFVGERSPLGENQSQGKPDMK